MRPFAVSRALPILILSAILLAGCGAARDVGAGYRPIDPQAAVFWDRQTTDSGELLRAIADAFNATHSGLPVAVEHTGNYGAIFQKVQASIQAGTLPAMAVSYESMTAEYILSDAVAPLDPFLNDPESGLDAEARNDFFPAVLESNRFAEHGDTLYSFPFSKSVLVMYVNRDVLSSADIETPARTWDEFLAHCRSVTEATGKPAHAIDVDCSTISGLIFAHGGGVYERARVQYDAEAAQAVFSLYETLAEEGLAYRINPGTFDDQIALSNGDVAYTFRTSAGIAPMTDAMEGRADTWTVAPLPVVDPKQPATILFGPNITVFRTTPEHAAAAWAFVRHFTSTEIQVRWALRTGYLPVRASAADHPDYQAYRAAEPRHRIAFDSLPYAKSEPNVVGWQEVRARVEEALTEVLTGAAGVDQALAALQEDATNILARHRDAAEATGGV